MVKYDIAVDVSCLVPQPLTGVGYYTRNLFGALASNHPDFRLHLLATSARSCRGARQALGPLGNNVRSVRFPTRAKHTLWTRFEWPPIEWLTGRIDIAHGAFHLLPASQHAKRVVTVFDLSGLRRPETRTPGNMRMHMALLRHAVSRADALIAISQSCRDDLVELLHAQTDRVHVVYGGVWLEDFVGKEDIEHLSRTKEAFKIDGDYFLHLGTLEPRKNLPRLIQAYCRVRDKRRDCPKLVLAGKAGWMYEEVFETRARLGLENEVLHTGYITQEQTMSLLRGACAFVYPSLYEGFGLPVLEAMAAGTPVLTSNVSSLPEVVGDCGILVDPESVEAIEAGLLELLDNPEQARSRAERARRRAASFSWHSSAKALAAIYRTLTGGGAES